jgi:hypothetical protein
MNENDLDAADMQALARLILKGHGGVLMQARGGWARLVDSNVSCTLETFAELAGVAMCTRCEGFGDLSDKQADHHYVVCPVCHGKGIV